VHVPADKIRSIVSLISEEAGFLLDQNVTEAIDKLDDAAASMAQAEALLKALGVESEEDLAALSNYFFVEVRTTPSPPHPTTHKLTGDLLRRRWSATRTWWSSSRTTRTRRRPSSACRS
jgi:hypothetical protein